MTDDLKPLPCPWCGSESEMYEGFVSCKSMTCGACGPTGEEDETSAVILWNRVCRAVHGEPKPEPEPKPDWPPLKPCPVCGGTPKMLIDDHRKDRQAVVICNKTGCSTGPTCSDAESAANAWNGPAEPKPEPARSCETCKHWDVYDDDEPVYGYCHRRGPVVCCITDEDGCALWPKVRPGASCGEWEAKS